MLLDNNIFVYLIVFIILSSTLLYVFDNNIFVYLIVTGNGWYEEVKALYT